MAEKYFDTQALMDVTIRNPKILGAEITGNILNINENYDWPESGKPFLPGYYFSLNRGSGFSVSYANTPQSGGIVMEMQPADLTNSSNPWFFDRLNINGAIRPDFIEEGQQISGRIVARENTEYTSRSFNGGTIWTGWGTAVAGQLIITDRKTTMPYSTDGSGFFTMVDEPAALGVSSRATFDFNPQNISKISQMAMRSSNQGDSQFATKDTILEIDKSGAAITPKYGPGPTSDSIKIVSGALASGDTRARIEISSSGSGSGVADILLQGRLIAPDAYTRGNASGRLLAANASGHVGYTQTPAMTRAWATSTTEASLTSTAHGYQVGSTSGANIAIGPAQIVGRNNGSPMKIDVPGGIGALPNPIQDGDAASMSWVQNYVAENGGSGGGGGNGDRLVGYTQNVTNSGNVASSTPSNVITYQMVLVAGKQYRIEFAGSTDSTVAADLAALGIFVDSTQLQSYTQRANSGTANQSQGFTVVGFFTASTTGTVQVRGTLARPVGTGNLRVLGAAANPMTLAIYELDTSSSTYDTGWLDCTLASGWVANGGTNQAPTVQCRRIGNQVRFRGRASGTLTAAATTQVVAGIPVECRPTLDSNMRALATTGGFIGWGNATMAGTISVHFKTPFVTGAAVIEFTGMSYLVN